MARINFENRADGRFSLSLDKGNSTETFGLPRELNVDLALREVDSDLAIIAGLLAFGSKLWQKEIEEPTPSLGLSERLFEAGYPAEWMPVLQRSGQTSDYALMRQNTLVVNHLGTLHSKIEVDGPGRQINAYPLDVAAWTGRLFGPSDIYFGTNLPVLEKLGGIAEVKLRIAIGVLMANDLRIGKIAVPIEANDFEEGQARVLSELASSVGIETEFLTIT